MWCRVFAQNDNVPGPGELERRLAGAEAVHFDRWLADEPGVRAELNNWAAAVESWEEEADYGALMERIIQTRQLFVLGDEGGLALCRLLAELTDGVYHVDGEGFFSSSGTLLAPEPP